MDNERLKPAFRLSIWRPARHERPISYFSEVSDAMGSFEMSHLHEQIYSWDPGQDDLFSVLDQELSVKLHEELLEGFAPHLPPADRSMQHLLKAVTTIRSELQNPGTSKWVDSVETVESGTDGFANLRINTALSVLNHLYWLFKTFEHVPGASVVIR